MTRAQAKYFEKKYKLFIRVWQTSNSVNEVRDRLQGEYGWYEGMEANDPIYRARNELSLASIRSYAYRLQKKDVKLKALICRKPPPDYGAVDYEALNEFSQHMSEENTDGR